MQKKRFLSFLLAFVMIFVLSTPAFACEFPDFHTQEETETAITLDISDLEVLEDEEVSYLMQETSDTSSTSSTIYWLNTAGFSSTDVSLPFYVSAGTLVTVIVLLKYMDGTTGTVGGAYAFYSGTLNVDGVARTIGRNVLLPPGNMSFDITGVSSNMFYSVKIYTP